MMKTSLTPKGITHVGSGWALKHRYQQHQLHQRFPCPSFLLRTLQPGLGTLWNFLCKRQRRLWSTFCTVQCSDSWKCFPDCSGAFGQNQGSPWGKWGFPLSVPPSCLPLLLHWPFSGLKMTHEPSPIMAHLVVSCFCIPPIYLFSFSFRLLYLLLSHGGFFSHKYSLSALDTSFCHQSHTFCPFSQQSHDLQVISSTEIGEVLSLSSASTQFPALLMLCAQGQVKMSSTEKIFLSLW